MGNIAHKKIVQGYYSKRARDYDRQKVRTWKSEQGFGAEILTEVVDALAGLEDNSLLEVGVGSGRISFPLLKKVKPWFVGLDLSREMVELVRARMSTYKQNFDLILGDAEHLPFTSRVFDAIICISTIHYFTYLETILKGFSRVLKEKGVFVYGDVTMHELDNKGFLDALERILSKAHTKYYKSSEMKKLLENHGFRVSKMKFVPYRKSFRSLMEDKGKYFHVKPETLHKCIEKATMNERKIYAINNNGLTLFYTLVTALKENKTS